MILHYPGLTLKELLQSLSNPKTKDNKGDDRELITQVLWEENKKTYGINVRYRSGLSYMTKLSVEMHSKNAYELDICECSNDCLNGQELLNMKLDIKNSWQE